MTPACRHRLSLEVVIEGCCCPFLLFIVVFFASLLLFWTGSKLARQNSFQRSTERQTSAAGEASLMPETSYIQNLLRDGATYKISSLSRPFWDTSKRILLCTMPSPLSSLRLISKAVLTYLPISLVPSADFVNGGSPPVCSSPQLSCHNTATVQDTCCFNSPGGQLLQTQFWDTNPPTGPVSSWTIHGLWSV